MQGRLFASVAAAAAALLLAGRSHGTPGFRTDQPIGFLSDVASATQVAAVRMCTTEGFDIYVMWLDDQRDPGSGNFDVWMNWAPYPGSDQWLRPPVRVNTKGSTTSAHAQLLCTRAGVFGMWEHKPHDSLGPGVLLTRPMRGGAPMHPEEVAIDPIEGSSTRPAMAADGLAAVVAWATQVDDGYDVKVAMSHDAGATWRRPMVVGTSRGTSPAPQPQVVMDHGAEVIAVAWEAGEEVRIAISRNGGVTFPEMHALGVGSHIQMCANDDNAIAVVWEQQTRDAQYVRYNYSHDRGKTWRPEPGDLGVASEEPRLERSVTCSMAGSSTHFSYGSIQDGVGDVYYWRLEDGEPVVASSVRADEDERNGDSTHPVVSGTMDYGAVAWFDDVDGEGGPTRGSRSDLYYQVFSAQGERWPGEPLRIDAMFSNVSRKSELEFIVVGGTWLAAWADNRSGSVSVYFQTDDLGQAIHGPRLEDFTRTRGCGP